MSPFTSRIRSIAKRPDFLILGLALGLRLPILGIDLWYDEAFTALISRLPLTRMIQATAGDVHPPGYYLITYFIMHTVGFSEVALRMPSVAFGLVTVWLTYRVALEIGVERRIALAAMFLTAINPHLIHYSQEARMYSLLAALVLGALLTILRRQYRIAGLFLFCMVWTHYYGVFYAATLVGLAAWQEWKTRHAVRHLAWPLAAPPATFAIWVPILIWQAAMGSGKYHWILPISPGQAIHALWISLFGTDVPAFIMLTAISIGMGILLYSLMVAIVEHMPGRGVVLTMIFSPWIMAILGSLVKPLMLPRAFLPITPLLWLVITWAMSRTRGRQLFAFVTLTPILLTTLYSHYAYDADRKGRVTDDIAKARAVMHPDLIVHMNDSSMIGWLLYAPDLKQVKMAPCGEEPKGALSEYTRWAIGIREVTMRQLPHRFWLVWSFSPVSPACENRLGDALLQHHHGGMIFVENDYVRSGIWEIAR